MKRPWAHPEADKKCWNLSYEAGQQELVELQQKERPEILIVRAETSAHFSVPSLLQKTKEEDMLISQFLDDSSKWRSTVCTNIPVGASVGTPTAHAAADTGFKGGFWGLGKLVGGGGGVTPLPPPPQTGN